MQLLTNIFDTFFYESINNIFFFKFKNYFLELIADENYYRLSKSTI